MVLIRTVCATDCKVFIAAIVCVSRVFCLNVYHSWRIKMIILAFVLLACLFYRREVALFTVIAYSRPI